MAVNNLSREANNDVRIIYIKFGSINVLRNKNIL